MEIKLKVTEDRRILNDNLNQAHFLLLARGL